VPVILKKVVIIYEAVRMRIVIYPGEKLRCWWLLLKNKE
jgi:hypothetical protein